MFFKSAAAILLSCWLLTACSGEAESPATKAATLDTQTEAGNKGVVTVYSSRAEHLIKPLFDQYTAETGVDVRYITDNEAALITRLSAEGERTPADIFLTVDAGNLWYATSLDLMRPITSAVLNKNIPANLREQNNRWFALSIRARTMVYSSERVKPNELSSYESLGEPNWRERLCLRTSKKVYNQSLVASLIAAHGEEKAEKIVAGWVENLSVAPLSNDTKAMEAVISGVCDVTLVNTYYFGRLTAKEPEAPIGLFWANQSGRGVHVNVSGAGVTTHAKNPKAAVALLEWLSEGEAQRLFAGLNKEFPVNPDVSAVAEVAAWGEFKADSLAVERVGQLQAAAVKLMDRVGYH